MLQRVGQPVGLREPGPPIDPNLATVSRTLLNDHTIDLPRLWDSCSSRSEVVVTGDIDVTHPISRRHVHANVR